MMDENTKLKAITQLEAMAAFIKTGGVVSEELTDTTYDMFRKAGYGGSREEYGRSIAIMLFGGFIAIYAAFMNFEREETGDARALAAIAAEMFGPDNLIAMMNECSAFEGMAIDLQSDELPPEIRSQVDDLLKTVEGHNQDLDMERRAAKYKDESDS